MPQEISSPPIFTQDLEIFAAILAEAPGVFARAAAGTEAERLAEETAALKDQPATAPDLLHDDDAAAPGV